MPNVGQRRRATPVVPSTFVIRKGDALRKTNAIRALDAWTEAGDVEVTLAPYRPKRSSQQHNLFWSWCEIVAQFVRDAGQPCCGEAVHDAVLGDVFGWEEMGFGKRRPRRSLTRPHQMGKLETMELLTRFEAWAAGEVGCVLPRPDSWEQDMEELRKQQAA